MRVLAITAAMLSPLIWIPGIGVAVLILATSAAWLGSATERRYAQAWFCVCVIDLVAGTIGTLWTAVLVFLIATRQPMLL